MNMIPCDKKCRRQREGYCSLNSIARLTNEAGANEKCGYYEPYPEKNSAAAFDEPRRSNDYRN